MFNHQFAQTFGLDDSLTPVFHCSVHTHSQMTPGRDSYIVALIYKKGSQVRHHSGCVFVSKRP